MLWPCSPPGRPPPQIRSSIWVGSSSGTLSRTLVTTWAARSSGRTSTREPLRARPIGERPNATITAAVMRRLYALAIPGRDRVDEKAHEQRRHHHEAEQRVHVRRTQRDHGHDQSRSVKGSGDLQEMDLAQPLVPPFVDQLPRQPLFDVQRMEAPVPASPLEAAKVSLLKAAGHHS